jgi:hypothetical protein
MIPLCFDAAQCVHFPTDGSGLHDPSEAAPAAIWLPGWVWIGSSVSEALVAFWASLAGNLGVDWAQRSKS